MPSQTKDRLYTPAFQTPLPEEDFENAEKPDEDKNPLQKLLKPVYGWFNVKNREVETNEPSQTYSVSRQTIKATPVRGNLLKTNHTGKPSALDYVKELPESLAKVTGIKKLGEILTHPKELPEK